MNAAYTAGGISGNDCQDGEEAREGCGSLMGTVSSLGASRGTSAAEVLASALLSSPTAHSAMLGFGPMHADTQSWSVLTSLSSDSQGVLSSARREIPGKAKLYL